METKRIGEMEVHPKMAECAALFRPTLAGIPSQIPVLLLHQNRSLALPCRRSVRSFAGVNSSCGPNSATKTAFGAK